MFDTDIRLLYRAIERIGDMPDGSDILDVPCGSGVALRGLRPSQKVRYVAGDIAAAMLDRTEREARRLGLPQVELRRADIERLPFDDGEFDLCVSFTGLHCFPDPRRAVFELARVTKPGGAISGSWVPTDTGARHMPARTLGRASGLMGPSATRPDVLAWLREAGYEDVEVVSSGGLAYFTGRRS